MTIDSIGSVTARPEWQSHLLITHVNGGWRTKLVEVSNAVVSSKCSTAPRRKHLQS
jgi:hypothetical protein